MRDRQHWRHGDRHADGSVLETTVQVVGTWSAGDTVTLHYTSDEPVQIWAEPYSHISRSLARHYTERVLVGWC